MITFRHIISVLNDHIVSYQLPFNQFSLKNHLIFLDEELSSPLESDSLIFCTANAFARCLSGKLPPRSCFLVSALFGSLPADIPHNCNYIAVSLPYPVLCTRVIAIYQQYILYQNKLSRVLPSRKEIEAYMEELSGLIGAACCLYNEKHQLLLHSTQDEDAGLLDTETLIHKLETTNTHLVSDLDCGYYSYMERQALQNHTFYLQFAGYKDFSDLDIHWIAREALSHILAGILDYNIHLYTAKELSVEKFIQDIMDETVINWQEVMERYCALSHSPAVFTTIVFILMPKSADALAHVFFLSELSRLFPDCLIGPYQNNLVMFHPNPEKTPRLDLHNLEFTQLLESYGAYAGCSMWTKYRFRTSIILAESNATFGKALRMDKDNRIFYHNDYSMYHLIDLAATSFQQLHHSKDLTYLMHPCILRINQYDLGHNTNLLEILYYYLITGCSVNETATRLSMHRNTIQGKLNKLGELIEDDYTKSGMIQCRLLVSCMLFFYQIRYLKAPFSRPQSVESSFKTLNMTERENT